MCEVKKFKSLSEVMSKNARLLNKKDPELSRDSGSVKGQIQEKTDFSAEEGLKMIGLAVSFHLFGGISYGW